MYEPRWYRDGIKTDGLKSFIVRHQESDLWIAVNNSAYSAQLKEYAERSIVDLYCRLSSYTKQDKSFLTALTPYKPKDWAPAIAKTMALAANKAGVGPMAAVAGAFSQEIGRMIEDKFPVTDIIIENGGDIYLRSSTARRIAVYAGLSPLSNKIAIEIDPSMTPLGICTSSGTVGHSLSFGKADAVTVLAKDTACADAYATAIGNMVKDASCIETALQFSAREHSILGILIVVGDKVGFRGNIKITKAD